MASISLEELHAYHSIDRDAFSRLVINLKRDPGQSLLVTATWLWLEEKGFPNIIIKMMNLTDPVINLLADEAATCLNCLQTNYHNPQVIAAAANNNIALPLTSGLMGREISLQLFLQNRFQAISGIKNFLHTVCSRIFTDILLSVLGTSSQSIFNNDPLVIPGFPHTIFGALTIFPRAIDHYDHFPEGGLWGWNPTSNALEDDRTMFLTFSRGFPVTKDEVRELFTRMYGENCVENVHMQENVPSDEQPLFARLVLQSVATVDQILCGRRVAKFRINGKHIWARKYERRDQ